MSDKGKLGEITLSDLGEQLTRHHRTGRHDRQLSELKCDFRQLFNAQVVTISTPPGTAYAPTLPTGFTLTPTFDPVGDLHFTVTNVTYSSPDVGPSITWIPTKTIFDSSYGVSITLQNNLRDLLVLTGAMGPGTISSEGNWDSTLFPQYGQWQAVPQQPPYVIQFPEYQWWTLLLEPVAGSPTGSKATITEEKTVILGFETTSDPAPMPFVQIYSFPSLWRASNLRMEATGISLDLASPDGQTYSLVSGVFSGGMSHLVCQGNWTSGGSQYKSSDIEDRQKNSVQFDGGTWTGTGGGAAPVPPPTATRGNPGS